MSNRKLEFMSDRMSEIMSDRMSEFMSDTVFLIDHLKSSCLRLLARMLVVLIPTCWIHRSLALHAHVSPFK